MKRKLLGEILRAGGKISIEELQRSIAEQKEKTTYLGEILLDRGVVAKRDIVAALEEVSRVSYLDCTVERIESEALALVPRAVALSCNALPVRLENNRLVVIMAAPQDLRQIDELRFTSGKTISPRMGFRVEIQEALAKYYPGSATDRAASSAAAATAATAAATAATKAASREETSAEHMEFISTSSRQGNQEAIQEMHADLRNRKTPAVHLVSEIIRTAMIKHASDIHIEPGATETAVRIRIDGVLRDLQVVARSLQTSLISRIKILADLDIAERRTPQDGRFMIGLGDRQLDLRVSTLPTQYGEKVVMRLLETNAPQMSFGDLGVPEDVSKSLNDLLGMPQGMLLVTGPTGSGKSTTLYSALHKLRKPSVNIVTVEDPVEYVLPGISQSHVNIKAGLTFASCLRSILRQDPNIIMVGEIRDRETAEIAMKAAQTGHLVLSSLHTNDSVSAIVRLLDLGIPGYLISSSVSGILAQRLVRKLCSCHSIQPATAEFKTRLIRAGITKVPNTMAVPGACEKCDHTGYKGRIGIYELLRCDESVRALIRSEGRTDEIRNMAMKNGMRLMQEEALDKLNAGWTTIDEILRVVPVENTRRTACSGCDEELLPDFRFCPYCGVSRAPGADAKEEYVEDQFLDGLLEPTDLEEQLTYQVRDAETVQPAPAQKMIQKQFRRRV